MQRSTRLMVDAGDIEIANLGGGRRQRVLVVSSARFHRIADRAIVAPALTVPVDDVQPPWRVVVGSELFALDALRTVELPRLLESVGRAGRQEYNAVRRALHAIT